MNCVDCSFWRESWPFQGWVFARELWQLDSHDFRCWKLPSTTIKIRGIGMWDFCPAKGPEYWAYKASSKHHQSFSFHLLDTIKTVKLFSFVPLGRNVCGEGLSWFLLIVSEIWGRTARMSFALVRKYRKSRGDALCKDLMRARHLKCFNTLRYNGKYIYETIDLANWI